MDHQKDIPIGQARKLAKAISKQFNISSHRDWLFFIKGGNPNNRKFMPFEEAREFVRRLKLKSSQEWAEYTSTVNEEMPDNIPSYPAKFYKNEWISWGDFLGTEHKVPSKFLPFGEARKFVGSLELKDCKEWDKYCKSRKKPKNIPHSPQKIYKDSGWMGWDAFFGSGMYSPEMSDKEIQWDAVIGKCHVGEVVDALRGDMTDEEIIDAHIQEAPDIIEALKKYMKKYPIEEDE